MGKPDDAEGWLLNTLTIEGGRPLSGQVEISGAKNAVLPLLAATAAQPGRYRLERCPALSDVDATAEILTHLGCAVRRRPGAVEVDGANVEAIPAFTGGRHAVRVVMGKSRKEAKNDD